MNKLVRVQALYLKEITLVEMREMMCNRCVVTNKLLAAGEALRLCDECPMNDLEPLGIMKKGTEKNEA